MNRLVLWLLFCFQSSFLLRLHALSCLLLSAADLYNTTPLQYIRQHLYTSFFSFFTTYFYPQVINFIYPPFEHKYLDFYPHFHIKQLTLYLYPFSYL